MCGGKTENYTPSDINNIIDRMINVSILRRLSKKNDSELLTRNDFDNALIDFTTSSTEGITLLKSDIGWEDVGGMEHIKKVIRETFELPTRYSKLFEKSPIKLRSGLLLYGPPGCGKTHIASAVSRECGLNFISVKGPELLNKYIGASEQAVRKVFEKAESAKPCIIFFDEFDSIAAQRGNDNTGVTDRVVNQLLCQLDGVESRNGVYVLVATSRPDLIDPALLRPGRLDKSLYCGLPNLKEREEILKVASKKLNVKNVNWSEIAKWCENYTGADLQAFLYSAHLIATHEKMNHMKKNNDDDEIKQDYKIISSKKKNIEQQV